MRRRTFLLSASAAALVLMAPNTAAALTPAPSQFDLPIRTLGVIEQALDVATSYGFTHEQRARFFSLLPSQFGYGEAMHNLRERVHTLIFEFDDVLAWNRARLLSDIGESLERRFPNDTVKQHLYMDAPEFFNGKTLRQQMIAGSITDLYYAAFLLGGNAQDRMYHKIVDLKNFG